MFRLRRKQKEKGISEKQINQMLDQRLEPYVSRKQLLEYLDKIKNDEAKRKMFDSLPTRKKLELLRYVVKKGKKIDKK